jgi:hypothetical protein
MAKKSPDLKSQEVKIKITCPACSKKQTITVKREIIAKKGLTTIAVDAACGHRFQVHLDKDLDVRGYKLANAVARTEIAEVDDQINKFVKDEGLKAPTVKPRQSEAKSLRNQFDTESTLQNVITFYKGANIEQEYKGPFAGSGASPRSVSPVVPPVPKADQSPKPAPQLTSPPCVPSPPLSKAFPPPPVPVPAPSKSKSRGPPPPPVSPRKGKGKGSSTTKVGPLPPSFAQEAAVHAGPPSFPPPPPPFEEPEAAAEAPSFLPPPPPFEEPEAAAEAPSFPPPPPPFEEPEAAAEAPSFPPPSPPFAEGANPEQEMASEAETPNACENPTPSPVASFAAESSVPTKEVVISQPDEGAAILTEDQINTEYKTRLKRINEMLLELELANMKEEVADGEFERKKDKLLTIKESLDAYYQKLLEDAQAKGGTTETPDQDQIDDSKDASQNPDE